MGEQRKQVSVFKLFLVRHVGETISLFNPASIIAGEAAKAWMLKDHPIKKTTLHASIIVSRALLIVTQLCMFVTALLLIVSEYPVQRVTTKEIVMTVTFIVVFICVVLALIFFMRLWYRKSRTTKALMFLQQKTMGLSAAVKETIAEYRNLRATNRPALMAAILFSILHWITGSIEFYIILGFLNVSSSIIHTLLADMGVIFFKSAGAFVPGQPGFEEYGNKVMLSAIGIHGTAIWLAASVLKRVRQLFWLFAGGAAYLMIKRNGNTMPTL